ncbi:unnamed protein product [Caretta caretta]
MAAASASETLELNGQTGGGGERAPPDRPRPQRWLQGNGPINMNHYANKKSAAESMLDIALLMANASQLKAVMEQGPSFSFYIPLIVLISISLILQIGVGVLLIFLVKYDLNNPAKHAKLDVLNNLATGLVFIIVVVNIFITAFGVQKPVAETASRHPAEAAVLSRGLSFCPSTPTNMIQFCGDLESYFRRLRLKEYFQNTSEQHTNPQRSPCQHYRKRDSRWTPPEGRNSRLDFYIECFRRRARAEIVEKQHHLPHNLSHAERNAIHSLRNNSDIIIKKADKGGAVVIMNSSEYEQEAARQLSNTSFYKPLPYDPTESYQKQLQHLLKKLPEKAQDQIRTDTPLEPRPGIFYLLPKIHKPGNPGEI